MMKFPTVLTPEISYVLLLFGLFVIPRVLQRLRIPAAITSFALGIVAGAGFGLFRSDTTVELLSSLGIVSLFLFAGLDVDVLELRREGRVILHHLVFRLATIAGATVAAALILKTGPRVSALLALALLTPSTGFILDSLHSLGLDVQERFWIRAKAIATELIALGVLFVTLQSETILKMSISAAVLIAMIALLPVIFRAFASMVVPYAPKSEFAFLVMVAVVCASVTLKMGVYYLVGAFVVGMTAQNFRERLPAVGSERMLHAVEAFASIFVPFYFFHAGLLIDRSYFHFGSLLVGAVCLALAIPLRLFGVAIHRRIALGESFRKSLRIGVPMLPTLVFTLVIAQILRERFNAAIPLVGGLIVYAVVNTLLPSLFFRVPPPEFDAPHALPVEVEESM
jgi:Kef-type K+ transport system membrane component KefB